MFDLLLHLGYNVQQIERDTLGTYDKDLNKTRVSFWAYIPNLKHFQLSTVALAIKCIEQATLEGYTFVASDTFAEFHHLSKPSKSMNRKLDYPLAMTIIEAYCDSDTIFDQEGYEIAGRLELEEDKPYELH